MTAAAHSFETLFGNTPHVRARANGAAILARDGERIIAAPIPRDTFVLLGRRRDPVVHAASANVAGPTRMVYVLGEETVWGSWVDQVQRVTAALQKEGHDLSGFDVLVRSAIPIGCGLGAGNALTVALLRALRQAFSLSLRDEELARLAARIREDASAMAPVLAHERNVLVIDGDAHETITFPPDRELRVLSDAAKATTETIDFALLLAALREGNADRLDALIGTYALSSTTAVALVESESRAA